MIAIVTIEGVLANGEDLRRAQPTQLARPLYDSLKDNFRMIAFTQAEPNIAQWWLKQERLSGWAAVMTQEPYLDYPQWKVRQVEDFLAEGWEVGMMLDTDPEVLERVSELGVPTMLVSYPTIKVGWRPTQAEPRPWSEVSSTI